VSTNHASSRPRIAIPSPALGAAVPALAAAAVIAASLCWGLVGVATTALPHAASPIAVASLRTMVGAGGFLILIALGRRRSPRPAAPAAPHRGLVTVAVAANTGTHVLFLLGLAGAGVAVSTVIHVGLCPLFTAFVQRLTRTGRLTRGWLCATLAATTGCVGLALDAGTRLGTHAVLGISAAALSALTYSTFSCCTARMIQDNGDAVAIMGTVFTGTAVCLAPTMLIFDLRWAVTMTGVLVTVFLGLAATTGSYLLLGFGLRHLPTSTTSALELTEPAAASVVAPRFRTN